MSSHCESAVLLEGVVTAAFLQKFPDPNLKYAPQFRCQMRWFQQIYILAFCTLHLLCGLVPHPSHTSSSARPQGHGYGGRLYQLDDHSWHASLCGFHTLRFSCRDWILLDPYLADGTECNMLHSRAEVQSVETVNKQLCLEPRVH